MQITNGELIKAIPIIQSLSNTKLPIKAAYYMSRNLIMINDSMNAFNISKERLINEYADKNENGNVIIDDRGMANIKKEHIQSWNIEYAELLKISIEVQIMKISIEDLISVGYDISPIDIQLIDFMLEY